MDRAMIVGQVMQHCKRLIEKVLEAADLQTVATASLAIFDQMREVARTLLQAKVDLEAHKLHSQAVTSCCPGVALKYVHTHTVQPTTLFGPITIPVRTFQCEGCGATQRPDDALLGLPLVGEYTDDIRCLYTPLVAELPHRIASDIFARFTGIALSSCGAQGIIESSAVDHRHWRQKAEAQDQTAVAEVLAGDDAARLRLEIAMDGVKAHIDGRWQEPKVATILARRLPTRPQVPMRGAVLAPALCLCTGFGSGLGRAHQSGHPRSWVGEHPDRRDSRGRRGVDLERRHSTLSKGTANVRLLPPQ